MLPESNVLSIAVTVCGAPPVFVQVIVSPTATVMVAGRNAQERKFVDGSTI